MSDINYKAFVQAVFAYDAQEYANEYDQIDLDYIYEKWFASKEGYMVNHMLECGVD